MEANEERLELCEGCIHSAASANNPEAFQDVLSKLTTAGFSRREPERGLAPGSNPFDVPEPKLVKRCCLDLQLQTAIEAAGYTDTPTENTGRQMFFNGELELHPVDKESSNRA